MRTGKIISKVLLLAGLFMACNERNQQSFAPSDKNSTGRIEPADKQPNPCEGIDNIDLCENVGGSGNLIIKKSIALQMIGNFVSKFKTEAGMDIRAFKPVYWLDKCAIQDIAAFLKTNVDSLTKKKLDGIRIFIACETKDNPIYGSDPYKRTTTINIFPTYFEQLGAGKSEHKTSKQKIILTGTCNSLFLKDYGVAELQNKEFKNLYRKEGTPQLKDNLSESIWIDACVLYTLDKLCKLPKANIDGVNVNMAAYDKTISLPKPVPGKFSDIQTTVILVPTHLVNGVNENYWEIIDCLYIKAEEVGLLPSGGFNHGELCPQKCE